MGQTKRPMPADFREVAPTMPIYKLQKHYSAKREVVIRWRDECGLERYKFVPHNRRPVPTDFAEMASWMHRARLIQHYACNDEILRRWIEESGVYPAPWVSPAKRKKGQPGRIIHFKQTGPSLASIRTWDAADEAANKLQKFCPVHRCDENGVANIVGKFWRVGWSVLTDAELIERANRKVAA